MSGLRESLRRLIDDNNTFSGRCFDWAIQALILISLVSFSLETLPSLSPEHREILRWIEIGTVSLFTLEYAARLWIAHQRLRFIFSFYGLIDLLAILPFYVAMGIDLRSLRVFRVFRVLSILKLTRYNRALRDLRNALAEIKEELILFFVLTLIVLYIAAVGIYYFESTVQPEAFASIFDCLWWAVATLTTVGYGDVYPVTTGGRVFTFFILMVGLGIVAVPTGLLAAALARKG